VLRPPHRTQRPSQPKACAPASGWRRRAASAPTGRTIAPRAAMAGARRPTVFHVKPGPPPQEHRHPGTGRRTTHSTWRRVPPTTAPRPDDRARDHATADTSLRAHRSHRVQQARRSGPAMFPVKRGLSHHPGGAREHPRGGEYGAIRRTASRRALSRPRAANDAAAGAPIMTAAMAAAHDRTSFTTSGSAKGTLPVAEPGCPQARLIVEEPCRRRATSRARSPHRRSRQGPSRRRPRGATSSARRGDGRAHRPGQADPSDRAALATPSAALDDTGSSTGAGRADP
jgi:hypothetical protein